MAAATVLELEKTAVPPGMIPQIDTTVRICPVARMVSCEAALLNDTSSEPLRVTEAAAHPVTEMEHLMLPTKPAVTPLAVALVAKRLALPSHVSVKGTPATLHVLACASPSLDTDCGAPGVGVPAVLLLDTVPTAVEVVHCSVTLVEPVVMFKKTGVDVAVAVALPPGLTVTLA